jgi:hypothetical protein
MCRMVFPIFCVGQAITIPLDTRYRHGYALIPDLLIYLISTSSQGVVHQCSAIPTARRCHIGASILTSVSVATADLVLYFYFVGQFGRWYVLPHTV